MSVLEDYEDKPMTAAKKSEAAVSMADILRAIADDKSLVLFNTIAIAGGDSDILITRLGVTRKQFYFRMSALINAGLMSRKNRQYELTSLGRIVYDVHLMIGKALNKFWELKALDSLETEHKLPIGERNRIISTLIDNEDIIKVLVKQY
jgi:hypothetical protein